MFIELDVMLFIDDELPAMLLPPFMLLGAILFGAMLFMALVCIICGALVVIMEPDIMLPAGGVSSACRASGSAKASTVNDRLSLVVFFFGFVGFLVWWVVW